jgi:hypothetical protein
MTSIGTKRRRRKPDLLILCLRRMNKHWDKEKKKKG